MEHRSSVLVDCWRESTLQFTRRMAVYIYPPYGRYTPNNYTFFQHDTPLLCGGGKNSSTPNAHLVPGAGKRPIDTPSSVLVGGSTLPGYLAP